MADKEPPPSPGVSSQRRGSLIVDNNDRIYIPGNRRQSRVSVTSQEKRKLSTVSYKSNKSEGGIANISYLPIPGDQDHLKLQEVHVGYDRDIRRKSVAYIKKELEINYHVVDIETLCTRYTTNVYKGLSLDQVEINREKFGKNMLTPPAKTPLWIKFCHNLLGGFQLLLWTASALSFIAYIVQAVRIGLDEAPPDNLYLGIALSVLVIVLGIFTFYQEYSSGKVMDSFAKLVPAMATVLRNGQISIVPVIDLVVGDVVDVKLGDSIPADIRILESSGLKVDNSSLTGESEPQPRSNVCTDENPMETTNLAFFSTNALEGTAKGLVVAVGDHTFIGRIAGLTTGQDKIDTPMSREVDYFVKIISFVAVFFGVAFFSISLMMDYTLIDAAVFLVGIIVANVPEGLLVTFTVILALTAKRMAEKNCVVRQLHAVETLGSCSVICSDKTGTLTQNKMTVSHIWSNNQVWDVGVKEDGTVPYVQDEPGFSSLSRVGSLCSRAKFLAGEEHEPVHLRKVNGDASESAILRFMEMSMGHVEVFQDQNKKEFEIPFNSSNKWQLSIHRIDHTNRLLVAMKGAPERVINLCHKIRIGDEVYDMDQRWKQTCEEMVENLGALGERVIGFCEAELPEAQYPSGYKFNQDDLSFLKGHLVMVGLVSLIDPPRPGVPNAVNVCRKAGIKVVMVTGDHPTTAKAIARKVGIISPGNLTREEMAKQNKIPLEAVDPDSCTAAVIPGSHLLELASEELDDILTHHSEIVFARVSPQQKLVIVEGFQRLGRIVAVTGDGVNDSPALRRADIGIAMGIAGSDVSKQAADMILLDDNFSSIVTGVEEGRLIFENLKKCIRYLLCANTANLLPFLLYITLEIPLPLGTIQMLAITLGTDILPTISLSYEKPEGDIMKRKPRNPETEKLVTQQLITYAYGVIGVIEAFAGIFTYVVIMSQNGFLPHELIGLRAQWDNQWNNEVEDSFGQQWTFQHRKGLEKTCWTAYFCTVVLCQWSNLLISKVRRDSLASKLFDNWIIAMAILGETLIACFMTYTPGLNYAISYMPLKFVWWLTPIPFMVAILVVDEIRRLILRTKPTWLWYQSEFFY